MSAPRLITAKGCQPFLCFQAKHGLALLVLALLSGACGDPMLAVDDASDAGRDAASSDGGQGAGREDSGPLLRDAGRDGGSIPDGAVVPWDGGDASASLDAGSPWMDAAAAFDAAVDLDAADAGAGDAGRAVRGMPVALGAAGNTSCALDDRGQVWCWGYDVAARVPVFVGTAATISDRSAVDSTGAAWYVDVSALAAGARVLMGTTDAVLARRVPSSVVELPPRNTIVRHSDGRVVAIASDGSPIPGLTWMPPAPPVAVDNDCAILNDGTAWCWDYRWYAAGVEEFRNFTLVSADVIDVARAAPSAIASDLVCYARPLTAGSLPGITCMNYPGGAGHITPYGVEVELTTHDVCSLQTRSTDATLPSTPGVGCVNRAGPGGPRIDFDGYTPLLGGEHHLAGGDHHLCVIRGSGVLCWGNNGYGQLGNGSTTATRAPVPVAW